MQYVLHMTREEAESFLSREPLAAAGCYETTGTLASFSFFVLSREPPGEETPSKTLLSFFLFFPSLAHSLALFALSIAFFKKFQ